MQRKADQKVSANSRINRLAKPASAFYQDDSAAPSSSTFAIARNAGTSSRPAMQADFSVPPPAKIFRPTGFSGAPSGSNSIVGFGFLSTSSPSPSPRSVNGTPEFLRSSNAGLSFVNPVACPSGGSFPTAHCCGSLTFTPIESTPGPSPYARMTCIDSATFSPTPGFGSCPSCLFTPRPLSRALYFGSGNNNSIVETGRRSYMEVDSPVMSSSFGTPRGKFSNHKWVRPDAEREAKRPRLSENADFAVPSPPAVFSRRSPPEACVCERSLKRVCCVRCAHLVYGVRVRRLCTVHPNTNFLMDLTECPNCRSDASHLREFSL